MKSILFHSYSLPPKNDGVTHRIMMWLEGFRKYYPDTQIVLTTARPDVADTILGYPVYRLKGSLVPDYLAPGTQNNIYIQKKRYFQQNYLILKNIVEKYVIQYIYFTGPEFIYSFKKIKKTFPLIKMTFAYHTHGSQYINTYFSNIFNRHIGNLSEQFAIFCHNISGIDSFDNMCIMSSAMKTYIETNLISKSQSLYTIPPILDKRLFPFKPRKFTTLSKINCVYVGRIAEEKNLHTMLSTLSTHWKSPLPPMVLTAVGDGPYLEKYQQEYSGNDNLEINFVGMVSREKVSSYYYNNDLMLFPSFTETLGFVTIEAMSCGIPVIGANGGGTTTLIEHNVSGLLLDRHVWETVQLCEIIDDLAKNPAKRERFVQNSHTETKKFSIQKNVDFLYNELFV